MDNVLYNKKWFLDEVAHIKVLIQESLEVIFLTYKYNFKIFVKPRGYVLLSKSLKKNVREREQREKIEVKRKKKI